MNAILNFYSNIDLFIIIFVRFIGFFILLPVFSGQYIPLTSKLFVAMAVSILVATSGNVLVPAYSGNLFGFASLLIIEFLTGFIVGFTIYLFMSTFLFAGQLIDYQIGFSMVSVYDPVSQIQVPITGNLYYLVMTAFFIQSGSLNYFIYQMFESYKTLPVGGAFIIGNGNLMFYIIGAIIDFFEIGVKIALPIVGTILIVDVVLGILVKAVPQMNIFVVGMPLKVFIGLIIFYLTVPMFGEVYRYVIEYIMKYAMNIIKGMSPP